MCQDCEDLKAQDVTRLQWDGDTDNGIAYMACLNSAKNVLALSYEGEDIAVTTGVLGSEETTVWRFDKYAALAVATFLADAIDGMAPPRFDGMATTRKPREPICLKIPTT